MKYLFFILSLFVFGCMNDDQKPVTNDPQASFSDSDCDGVDDSLDQCPGINDSIDNNGDGFPDCKYPPPLAQIINAWKCGGGTKVIVCTKTPSGGFKTVCTYYSALQTHINNGGFLGGCNSIACP